jgi:hypothetical protein
MLKVVVHVELYGSSRYGFKVSGGLVGDGELRVMGRFFCCEFVVSFEKPAAPEPGSGTHH